MGIEQRTVMAVFDFPSQRFTAAAPERDHYFWIGPGRFDKKGGATSAIKSLKIDKLELIRVD